MQGIEALVRERKRAASGKQAGRVLEPVVADGKRRLIAAGLRLAARGRSFESLGLREVAREAKLNPNTFYRHFGSMEELALAAVEEITRKLRGALAEIRRGAAKHADATRGSAEFFIEFVLRNPDAFVVGLREIHGASPAIRGALRDVMDEIAREAADDIAVLGLAPTADRELLLEVAKAIVDRTFFRALDYIERPRERRKFVEETIRFARMLFIGSASAGALSAGTPSGRAGA